MKRSATSPNRSHHQQQCSGHDRDDEKGRTTLALSTMKAISPNHVHAWKVLGMIFAAFVLVGLFFDAMTSSPKKVPRKKQMRGNRKNGSTALVTSNVVVESKATAVAVTPTLASNSKTNNLQQQLQKQPEAEEGSEAWYTVTDTVDDETVDDDAKINANANKNEDDSSDEDGNDEDDGVQKEGETKVEEPLPKAIPQQYPPNDDPRR